MPTVEIDRETLDKAAAECLERPRDAVFWDDRLFTTHGAVISWADRGDDVLSESNYHVMLDAVRAAAVHADRDPNDDVIDASISHWLVGSLRQVFVRVYADEERTEYTPSFIEATALALSLQDYPILDESDYSERELEAWVKVMDMAIGDAARTHRDVDTPEDERAIVARLHDRFRDGDARSGESCSPDEVRWADVQRDYDATRELVLAERAAPFLAYWHGVPEGQLSLPI